MRDFFERYRATVAAFITLVLPLFLLYVHGRHPRKTTIIEQGLMEITSPPQNVASRMLSGLSGVWSSYVALVDLKEDNRELKGENRLLTGEALRAKELGLENQRLRKLLEFKRERKDLKTVAAHVIGKDVSPYARVVRVAVDVGDADGIAEGMPVVANEGLVGRVGQVSGQYAEVMLTVDPRSSVNVKVAGKGVTGTLQGSQASSLYSARLLYLHKAEAVAIQDTLVTSGHDRIFPPGIEVGYIRSVEERQRGVYYEMQVTPAVNFSILEEVLIVVSVTVGSESTAGDGEGAP